MWVRARYVAGSLVLVLMGIPSGNPVAAGGATPAGDEIYYGGGNGEYLVSIVAFLAESASLRNTVYDYPTDKDYVMPRTGHEVWDSSPGRKSRSSEMEMFSIGRVWESLRLWRRFLLPMGKDCRSGVNRWSEGQWLMSASAARERRWGGVESASEYGSWMGADWESGLLHALSHPIAGNFACQCPCPK